MITHPKTTTDVMCNARESAIKNVTIARKSNSKYHIRADESCGKIVVSNKHEKVQ